MTGLSSMTDELIDWSHLCHSPEIVWPSTGGVMSRLQIKKQIKMDSTGASTWNKLDIVMRGYRLNQIDWWEKLKDICLKKPKTNNSNNHFPMSQISYCKNTTIVDFSCVFGSKGNQIDLPSVYSGLFLHGVALVTHPWLQLFFSKLTQTPAPGQFTSPCH